MGLGAALQKPKNLQDFTSNQTLVWELSFWVSLLLGGTQPWTSARLYV